MRKSDMITFDDGTYFSYERIGEFHSDGVWIHPTRTIHSHELIMVLEGEVALQEAHMAYSLRQNQMILLEEGKEHGGMYETDAPVSFYWMHFRTDRPLPLKTYTGSDFYDIRQMMKRLLHITNTPGYSEKAADAQCYLIFEELVQRGQKIRPSNRVGQILEYIRINADCNLSVEMLATHFGYSPDYLGKLFQKEVGMGLKAYLVDLRMKCARDLLLTTEDSGKEIAEKLGFSNENLFLKFFQYHEKISPTAFRRRYYNTHMNKR